MNDNVPPPLTPWEAIQLSRQKAIADGLNKPGEEGAFWRLMAIVDTANIEQWIKGEHVRGTPPTELFGVVSQVIASCTLLTASVVARYQIRGAAQEIMRAAATILEADINRVLKPPAVAMPGQKNVMRMPPRLRRVLAGGEAQGPTSNVKAQQNPTPNDDAGSQHGGQSNGHIGAPRAETQKPVQVSEGTAAADEDETADPDENQGT